MIAAAVAYTHTSGIGRTWEAPGMTCTLTRCPMRSFNQVFVREPLRDAAALLQAAEAYRREGLRFRVRCVPDDGLRDKVAAAAGLEMRWGIPSMALQRAAYTTAGAPGGLDIRRVTDPRTLADHVALVAGAFGWQAEHLALVFTPALIEAEGWSAYVGHAGGEPAATAQLFVRDGVAGLYYVGTAEAHRRHGFGEAVTRAAVEAGFAAGCDIATLQASPLGQPVYERLGFEVVAHYPTYLPPGEEH